MLKCRDIIYIYIWDMYIYTLGEPSLVLREHWESILVQLLVFSISNVFKGQHPKTQAT